MKILAICSFPVEAAATRFRLVQFVRPCAERDIDITVRPFLNSLQFKQFYERGSPIGKAVSFVPSVLRRIGELSRIRGVDLVLVQREAMIFGPAVFEWLYQRIGRLPMVLDLDDATYVPYVSPSFGRLGSLFKFFGKTDKLIDRADLVICGNRFIAEYVEKRGRPTLIIPTVVDTDEFKPAENTNKVPVIGWIGTHSTFPFVEKLFPVLVDLAKKHRFKLRIVGSGRPEVKVDGVEIENLEWRLDRETEDFQSLDIGLYPIVAASSLDASWLMGKSGFKAIQYMAVGIPFVMSPVGVSAEMGEPNVTHYNAVAPEDWYDSLDRLLGDRELRLKMGSAARQHSLEHYELEKHASRLSEALMTTLRDKPTR